MLAKVYNYAFGAGQTKSFPGGRFLRLMSVSSAVDIEFFDENGSSMGVCEGVTTGFNMSFFPRELGKDAPLISFGKVKITSAAAQNVQVIISRQPVGFDALSGNVTATVTKAGTYVQYDRAISIPFGGAAPLLLLPANPARRKALIRNISTSAGDLLIGNADVALLKSHSFIPGEPVVLEHTDDIYVKGTVVNVHVDFAEILD